MSYAHKLQYAGSDPFEPERLRVEDGEMTHNEYEVLTQDGIYRKLAEVRYLANALEGDLDSADGVPTEAWAAVFDTIGVADAPLEKAVERYVDHWLAEYRPCEEVVA